MTMDDQVIGYRGTGRKCVSADAGRIGGCLSAAEEDVVLIRADGTERHYGPFCRYHAGCARTFFGAKAGDRIEHRRLDGAVLSSQSLKARW